MVVAVFVSVEASKSKLGTGISGISRYPCLGI